MSGANFKFKMIFLYIILAALYDISVQAQAEEKLQLVQILFRHGERSPSKTYKNDPYINYPWPSGWDQLLNRGKKEMYDLGIRFREAYAHFLPDYYFPNDTYVLSSFADRCHMSAQLLLAGLYPPIREQIWNPGLLWQPIPIHDTPRHLDKTIAMRKKCPKYDKALEEAYNTDKIKEVDRKNADLYKYLSNHTGDNITNILALELLYNTLEIERNNNLELPAWTTEVFPDKMIETTKLSYAIFTDTTFMKRMKGGVFIKDVIKHAIEKRDLPSSPKLYLYSGHDVTLVNVIRSLGFEEMLKPGFGASLTFEMYKTKNDIYTIKLLYRDNSTAEPEQFKHTACGDPCELGTFIDVLKPVIPNDWERECQLDGDVS